MGRALMEMPEVAADGYRREIGAIEMMCDSEICTRFTFSRVTGAGARASGSGQLR